MTSRKALCIIPALVLCLCCVLSACSTHTEGYPVTVGHSTFTESPVKVICLSDNIADIISYMGYGAKICGRSDECTQEKMKEYITSVGSETDPNLDMVTSLGATVVFTDKPLSTGVIDTIEEEDLTVINLLYPESKEQLLTVYESLGKILGGNEEGTKKGTDSYERLISVLESAESEVKSIAEGKTVCYLFTDQYGNLTSYTGKVNDGMVMDYLGATNVASNFNGGRVEDNILKLANPDYIFFDSEEVMNKLQSSSALKNLNALKNSTCFQIPKEELTRHGQSLIDTQKLMLSMMFPNLITTPKPEGEDISAAYGITISEGMSFKNGDDAPEIATIQQRLIDLGFLYLGEDEPTTTYFGSMSEEALKNFQQANSLEASGIASYETLRKLFMSDSLGANGNTFVPDNNSVTNTEPDDTPATDNLPSSADAPFEITADAIYEEGTYHDNVVAIQQRLIELKFLDLGEDEPTTYFGGMTAQAVKDFQKANGLEESGIADKETLDKMFSNSAVANN